MELLPRLIVPGSPQPGFSPQPLILDPRQGMSGAARGAQPLILTPNQLEVEAQQQRWFLSQLPYPMVRVQPLERDIGPQAPAPAWGELPVRDWRSELYASPANPDAAIADAVGRRSSNRRVRRNGRLYTGEEAANRLPMGDLSARQAAGATLPAALVDAAPQLAAIAPTASETVLAAPADPGTAIADAVSRRGSGSSRFSGVLDSIDRNRDLGRNALEDVVDSVYFRNRAVTSAVSSPLGNAAKIENSIAGTQTQPMAPGSGGAILTEPDTPADPARLVSPAGATPAASALDAAVLGAEVLADPVLSNVSDGGPGTSTAKGNSVIDAKLRERIEAFRRGTTAPLSPYQLPLTTGMGAGTSTAAPATVAAAGGGSAPNNPPNNPPNDPPDDGSGSRRSVRTQRTRPGAGQTMDAILSAPDLGLGSGADKMMRRAGAAARNAGMPNVGRALFRAGGAARVLAPAAALASPLIPAAMGAVEGYDDAGAGGAVIQGGSSLAGAAGGAAIGSFILPGPGTVIGGALGAMLGSGAGKGITDMAQGAVDAAQSGDTGLMGQIGRTLDPVIDTDYERQQRQITREMNSPAMKAVQLQQQRREAQARADQARALLLQSYLS